MRRGEIADLLCDRVDFGRHIVRLEKTKNGTSRNVPLTERAERALRELPRLNGDKVFSCKSDALGKAFARACKRANIINLRLRDLRHEAASRMAQHMGPTTLAKVMGWKTLQMAMRYVQPTVEELVQAVRDGEGLSRRGAMQTLDPDSGKRQSSNSVRVDAPLKRPEAALNPSLPVHQILNDGGERGEALPADFRNTVRTLLVGTGQTVDAQQADAGRIVLEHLPQALFQAGASVVPLSLPMAATDSRTPPERQTTWFRIKGSSGAQ